MSTKPGEGHLENKLQEDDLFYTYDADAKLDARRVVLHYFLILLALSIVRWYFKGRVAQP
ncbi:MAG: hypothetical protein ABIE70_11310 [bacterium]